MALILRISRDNVESWHHLPFLLIRMAEFTRTFDPEGIPEETVELVRVWFSNGDPRLGLWIAIDNDNKIVGHLFVTPEPMALDQKYWKFGLARQAWVDKGVDIRKEVKEAFSQALRWLESLGIDSILALTHKSEISMYRSFGFQPYKVMLERSTSQEE